jgi:hypothetical protein
MFPLLVISWRFVVVPCRFVRAPGACALGIVRAPGACALGIVRAPGACAFGIALALAVPAPARAQADGAVATPQASAAQEAGPERPDAPEGDEWTFYARVGGEYQVRGNALSDVPLTPIPSRPGSGTLGQNAWAEQWLRLRGEAGFRDRIRLVGSLDLLWGVAFGDLAIGTTPAAWPRDAYGYPGLRLRHLYLDWRSPIGIVRVGQMGFSWGLGLVANDGETPPPFGDYRFGDLVRRILFATRPFGESSPIAVAVATDWVAWDLVADADRPCRREGQSHCGDTALQGVLATWYEQGDDRLGGYVAYRHQTNYLGDTLEIFVLDLYGRWHAPEPTGGRLFVAAEGAVITGVTSMTRTVERPSADVQQLLAAVQIGRTHRELDLVLEGGYASGDSNPEDGVERRATFDPDHRIGLVLFPEVIAWHTARSAHLAQDPDLAGRPARGSELLPTHGGVSGAFYLFGWGVWRPAPFFEARLGAVLGWASSDVVDPWRLRAESRAAGFRGGDPARRDLGLELDAALLLHGDLGNGIGISGGLEGGILFPGRAFDDAEGRAMGEVGLARARLGLRY